ncbi:MAG: hypothetical protein HQM11_08925 [SAR324 cluster bacterium]|nr:hypothetical protein [SAR324 cluster bacterium]
MSNPENPELHSSKIMQPHELQQAQEDPVLTEEHAEELFKDQLETNQISQGFHIPEEKEINDADITLSIYGDQAPIPDEEDPQAPEEKEALDTENTPSSSANQDQIPVNAQELKKHLLRKEHEAFRHLSDYYKKKTGKPLEAKNLDEAYKLFKLNTGEEPGRSFESFIVRIAPDEHPFDVLQQKFKNTPKVCNSLKQLQTNVDICNSLISRSSNRLDVLFSINTLNIASTKGILSQLLLYLEEDEALKKLAYNFLRKFYVFSYEVVQIMKKTKISEAKVFNKENLEKLGGKNGMFLQKNKDGSYALCSDIDVSQLHNLLEFSLMDAQGHLLIEDIFEGNYLSMAYLRMNEQRREKGVPEYQSRSEHLYDLLSHPGYKNEILENMISDTQKIREILILKLMPLMQLNDNLSLFGLKRYTYLKYRLISDLGKAQEHPETFKKYLKILKTGIRSNHQFISDQKLEILLDQETFTTESYQELENQLIDFLNKLMPIEIDKLVRFVSFQARKTVETQEELKHIEESQKYTELFITDMSMAFLEEELKSRGLLGTDGSELSKEEHKNPWFVVTNMFHRLAKSMGILYEEHEPINYTIKQVTEASTPVNQTAKIHKSKDVDRLKQLEIIHHIKCLPKNLMGETTIAGKRAFRIPKMSQDVDHSQNIFLPYVNFDPFFSHILQGLENAHPGTVYKTKHKLVQNSLKHLQEETAFIRYGGTEIYCLSRAQLELSPSDCTEQMYPFMYNNKIVSLEKKYIPEFRPRITNFNEKKHQIIYEEPKKQNIPLFYDRLLLFAEKYIESKEWYHDDVQQVVQYLTDFLRVYEEVRQEIEIQKKPISKIKHSLFMVGHHAVNILKIIF